MEDRYFADLGLARPRNPTMAPSSTFTTSSANSNNANRTRELTDVNTFGTASRAFLLNHYALLVDGR